MAAEWVMLTRRITIGGIAGTALVLVLTLVARLPSPPDDPVGSLRPRVWASTISVDDLLHHTSGIPDYVTLLAERGVALDQVTTQDDAIEAVAAAQPNFPRGERWQYSNSNFILLAEIVQRVSGVDFAEFLADRVFAPLRLDAVLEPTKAVPDKAVGYLRIGEHWVPQVAKWEQYGDGSIQTTPRARAVGSGVLEVPTPRQEDRRAAPPRPRGRG